MILYLRMVGLTRPCWQALARQQALAQTEQPPASEVRTPWLDIHPPSEPDALTSLNRYFSLSVLPAIPQCLPQEEKKEISLAEAAQAVLKGRGTSKPSS